MPAPSGLFPVAAVQHSAWLGDWPSTFAAEVVLALVVGAALAWALSRDESGARVEARVAPPPPTTEPTVRSGTPPGWLSRFRDALAASRGLLRDRFDEIFGGSVDESALDDLEDALVMADVGVETARGLVEGLREPLRSGATGDALRSQLRDAIRQVLIGVHQPLSPKEGLWVVLVVGVNGSGKTTTIGKLAARLRREGRRVLIAAADTYRAAAADQLAVWAERAEADLVRGDEGADPASVVFRACERASQQGYDVLIIDTSGRLQTKKPLMAELEKLRRVVGKHVPDGPHETLLVLDGTMGQNGLSQATLFHEATPLTGVVVTKLDGSAKGGMVLTIAREMALPVKLVGLGEGVDDLRDFDPEVFVETLA